MMRFLVLLLLVAATARAATSPDPNPSPNPNTDPSPERAGELKDFLHREKGRFTKREALRRSLFDELDRLNTEQNKTRRRIEVLTSSRQELAMSLENVTLEVQHQRALEVAQRQRLSLLLRVLYRLRRDGVLRFVVGGENLTQVAGRVRMLYRALRSHGEITRVMEERALRLKESEARLAKANRELEHVLSEVTDQESFLKGYLQQKKSLLAEIQKKQGAYRAALREFRQVSHQLKTLFKKFDAGSDRVVAGNAKGRVPLPLEAGQVVQSFGKSVHQDFQTVTYFKGIEIGAEMNAPVTAVLEGTVEYEGWLKGLGNVVILRHNNGLYSLSAHLNRSLAQKGAKVNQGETIGLVGDTGSSEEPSLYFELRENGKAVDPVAYFQPDALTRLNWSRLLRR